jgi:hypothetical protein
MMAFVAAGRPASAMRLAEALPSSQGNESSSLLPEDAFVVPLCEALLAFANGDYAACASVRREPRSV